MKLSGYEKLLEIKIIEQLIKYFFVGGSSAIIEWITFYFVAKGFHLHYFFATMISFAVAMPYNYFMGRKFVFKKQIIENVSYDIIKVYLVTLCGFPINLFLMWIFIDNLYLDSMLSKMIATGIAFLWNFASRRFLIYNTQ